MYLYTIILLWATTCASVAIKDLKYAYLLRYVKCTTLPYRVRMPCICFGPYTDEFRGYIAQIRPLFDKTLPFWSVVTDQIPGSSPVAARGMRVAMTRVCLNGIELRSTAKQTGQVRFFVFRDRDVPKAHRAEGTKNARRRR